MTKKIKKDKYLSFINKYWEKVTQHKPEDIERNIGLPYPFVSPNCEKYTELYYWDSYFHVLGLLEEKKIELAKNIVDNFIHLIDRFGIIPNANSYYFLSRSQPPFLSSMVLAVYHHTKDKEWLKNAYVVVRREYEEVWTAKGWKNNRNVYEGLSRYYDINDIHFLAELESGWDLTSRYMGRCLDILPIDLNCLLYKYEKDLSKISKIIEKSKEETKKWNEKAEQRSKSINKLMWDRNPGVFRDYDYVNRQKTHALTLAMYFSMYMKLASKEQAELLVKNLEFFEYDGGLVTTKSKSNIKRDQYSAGKSHTQQWDYPNGWAPLHLIVVEGLLNYGYKKEAKRIMEKWIATCERSFNKMGFFLEKYNVVDTTKCAKGHYDIQGGFGWTNAVYVIFRNKIKKI
ncbi:hypothetical protein GF376_02330 [Candidatus Peregrinibacteria bacterium]|nr:hypothetical protein [Candidatus Peregrinibacteria bacterium]